MGGVFLFLCDQVILIFQVFDNSLNVLFQCFDCLEVMVFKDDYVMIWCIWMWFDKDWCVLIVILDCDQKSVEVFFIIFKVVMDERFIDYVWIEIYNDFFFY